MTTLLPFFFPVLLSMTSKSPRAKAGIKQSVSRWCYQKIELDELCKRSAEWASKPSTFSASRNGTSPPLRALCSMSYAGGGDIPHAMNRVGITARSKSLRKNIPIAAKMGLPNVITFPEIAWACPTTKAQRTLSSASNKVKKIAEDNGVTICLELLNSKVDHHDYMCDHTCLGRARRAGSEFAARKTSLRHLPHANHGRRFDPHHSGQHQMARPLSHRRVPGRHELDDTQEVHWDAVMRGIASTNYSATSRTNSFPCATRSLRLREAADLCDV